MRSLLTIILLLLPLLPSSAQDDRRDVRRGNRQFRKENYRAAEIDYRKAVLKDSTSLKAQARAARPRAHWARENAVLYKGFILLTLRGRCLAGGSGAIGPIFLPSQRRGTRSL